MKTTFQYDHYYKYDEVKSNLEYFANEYPDLVKLEVNLVTEEGRNQYEENSVNDIDVQKPDISEYTKQ